VFGEEADRDWEVLVRKSDLVEVVEGAAVGAADGRRSRRLKTSVRWVRPDHVRASAGDAGQ
jgi:hypothetical protein